FEAFRRIQLTRKRERIAGWGPGAQSTMGMLPDGGTAEKHRPCQRIAHIKVSIAAIDLNRIEWLFDERIDIRAFDSHLRHEADETRARRDADLSFLEITTHDCFALIRVVVSWASVPEGRRHRPGAVAETVPYFEERILERRVPAAALVDGQPRRRRHRTGVLREHVR